MKRFLAFMLCMVLVAVPVFSSISASDSNVAAPCFIFDDALECD
ncbi:MAG: hypothetical protein ACI4ES_15170 [Roseburia sp.]